jgi:predicted Zn-dependent peptidase
MNVIFEKLDNGVLAACDSMKNVESIALKIRVNVGGAYESVDESGMSHFVEHMAFKGTNKRDKHKVAIALDELGGNFNAYTSKEQTAYHCSVPKEYFSEAFDILADIVVDPLYLQEEINLERNVIIQEIGMYEDSPQDKISEEYYKICFKNQAFGNSILGTVESVGKFNRDDFLHYMDRYYTNNNIIIGVAGDIDFDELKTLTNKYFDGRKIGEKICAEKPIFTGGDYREERDLEQIQVLIGFPGVPKTLDMDFFKIEIAGSVLGGGMSSRLFQEIRENRGLAYSVSSWHSTYSNCGIFSIYGGVEPKKANEFITQSLIETKKMIDFVTEEELKRVKKQLRCSILMSSDSTGSRASHLISSIANYGRYIETKEILHKIDSVTLKDIKDAISMILSSKNKTLASIGKVGENVMKYKDFCGLIA